MIIRFAREGWTAREAARDARGPAGVMRTTGVPLCRRIAADASIRVMHGAQTEGGADTAALLARLAAAFTSYQRALPGLIDLVDLRRRGDESVEDWRGRITAHLARHEHELATLEKMLARAADGSWRASRPLLEASPDLLGRLGGDDPAVALTRDLWVLWWRSAGFPDSTATLARLHECARRTRRLVLSLLVLARLGRRFSREAVARFAAEVASPGADTIEPERLHDRWIEACESAYAEIVFTPRYSRAFGRLVNASVGARAAAASAFEPLLAAAGVPTRAEMTQLVAAQHALASDLEALRTAAASATKQPQPRQASAPASRPRKPARNAARGSGRTRRSPSTATKRTPAKVVRKPASAWDIAGLAPPADDE